MTETSATSEPPPPALRARGRWPGLVWAVPIAALIIVGYLGLRAVAQRGIDIVVTFKSADGVRVGDTKVIYRGVEAGRVTRIALNTDGRRVDLTVRLDPRAKPALLTSTVFWLIGAQPSLTDISSIKAALAGVVIGMAPGTTGAPTRRYVGLERPPAVIPGTPGTPLVLSAQQVGSIRPGASLYYHGLEVGKVTALDLVGPQQFDMSVFVAAPYDRFIHTDTLFWSASPVQISLTGSGLSTQFAPAAAAISGGVEFDTPEESAGEPKVPDHSRFTLFYDRGHALAGGGEGPTVNYSLAFRDPVGDVDVGSPVRLGGFQVGAVSRVGMSIDPLTGVISSPVIIAIQPKRLRLKGVTAPARGDWRSITDSVLGRLLAHGYRARLVQNPPLIGARYVSIDKFPDAGPGVIGRAGSIPSLPTRDAGDINALTDKASAILDKFDALPIEAIGNDVRRITGRLGQILDSPQVTDSLRHLDGTLNEVDGLMHEVRPQVGPLIANLNLAADQLQATAASANGVLSGEGSTQDASLPAAIRELTDAARSIRALSDYLGRHPESLLRGKAKDGK